MRYKLLKDLPYCVAGAIFEESGDFREKGQFGNYKRSVFAKLYEFSELQLIGASAFFEPIIDELCSDCGKLLKDSEEIECASCLERSYDRATNNS